MLAQLSFASQSSISVTHNYVTPREISQEINMVIKKTQKDLISCEGVDLGQFEIALFSFK